jgi:hypothetical protein
MKKVGRESSERQDSTQRIPRELKPGDARQRSLRTAFGTRSPRQGLHATRCLGSILTVSDVSGKESCNED